jgi:hypothetical protein
MAAAVITSGSAARAASPRAVKRLELADLDGDREGGFSAHTAHTGQMNVRSKI